VRGLGISAAKFIPNLLDVELVVLAFQLREFLFQHAYPFSGIFLISSVGPFSELSLIAANVRRWRSIASASFTRRTVRLSSMRA
jgi:hypothetical protein